MRNRLVLDAAGLEKLTGLVGGNFDACQTFVSIEEDGREGAAWQLRVTQHSHRETKEANSVLRDRLDFTRLLQRNPRTRFSIGLYQCLPDGVHYLVSLLELDAVGRVINLTRVWTRSSVPIAPGDEKPSLLFDDDEYGDSIWATGHLQKIRPSLESELRAEALIETFAKILKERNFEFLPLDDPRNVTGIDLPIHRISGWSRR